MSGAVIVVHPQQNYVGEREQEAIIDYIEDIDDEFDLFYIPDTMNVKTNDSSTENFMEDAGQDYTELPPGFGELDYDGYFIDRDLGFLYPEDSEMIVDNYDWVELCGADRNKCVKYALGSIEGKAIEKEVEIDININAGVSFTYKDGKVYPQV